MKEFKGRVLAAGNWKGEAVVSRQGVNTLATFQKSALKNAKEVIVSDQNNPDIFGKNITGKALCLPITIGSTTGGLVIQTICAMKIIPPLFCSASISTAWLQAVLCLQRSGRTAT